MMVTISTVRFHLEKMLGGKYLEIACHEVPCYFLEGVAHKLLGGS